MFPQISFSPQIPQVVTNIRYAWMEHWWGGQWACRWRALAEKSNLNSMHLKQDRTQEIRKENMRFKPYMEMGQTLCWWIKNIIVCSFLSRASFSSWSDIMKECHTCNLSERRCFDRITAFVFLICAKLYFLPHYHQDDKFWRFIRVPPP